MVRDLKAADPSDGGVFGRVSRQLGVGSQSLRLWVAQAATRDDPQPQVSESESRELKELRNDVKELRSANDILHPLAISGQSHRSGGVVV